MHRKDKEDDLLEVQTVSRDVVVGYEKETEPYNAEFMARSIEPKPVLELSDLDRKRLEEKRAEIERIKSSGELESRGILVLHDYKRSNLRDDVDYEIEMSAKQAALLSVLLGGTQDRFRTYEEISAEPKTSISFDSITRAIGKFLGRGEER